jgi:transposase
VAFNFVACDRDQELLLPPSLREWLPEDHLAWFLIDAVAEIDPSAFLADYREDGWGRPAFDPEVMVTLLLYAYAVGERSSRAIERRCREDVACRVITANACPDHATIARFRQRHEQALAGVFTEVLRLCAEAGLLSVGLVALDGTKLKANASKDANRSYAEVSREVERMLCEAAAADAAEDERLGAARGGELPEELAERTSRRARLRQAKAKLEADARGQRAGYEAHLAERARIEAERGRPLRGRKPKPPAERPAPSARVNTTDPDSALLRTRDGFVRGYNAQAVVAEGQLIVAAELSTDSPDGRLLHPMAQAARTELAAVGLEQAPGRRRGRCRLLECASDRACPLRRERRPGQPRLRREGNPSRPRGSSASRVPRGWREAALPCTRSSRHRKVVSSTRAGSSWSSRSSRRQRSSAAPIASSAAGSQPAARSGA